jgi:SAM-dependent methyltransferase
MGLDTHACQVLVTHIQKLFEQRPKVNNPLKIASLGYQDILCIHEMVDKWFGAGSQKRLFPRPNSNNLLRVHGKNGAGCNFVPTMQSFFDLLGNVEVDTIDFQQYQGTEIVFDLGTPLPPELEKQYDVIIDGGTIEHIFNISQALNNITKMLRIGGIVYHAAPINLINHGFYNISPTLFYDYYGDSGFEIEYAKIVTQSANGQEVTWTISDAPHMDRIWLSQEGSLQFVAKRTKEMEILKPPIQGKYREKEKWM